MADPPPTELPIFELPLALLPSERVPLHIFEERYKRMIGDCLDRSEPFGVVFRDDSGARSIGCSAEVEDVLERFDDGRMNIVVTGRWPFTVLDRHEAAEYPIGTVEPIEAEAAEEESDPGPARQALADLIEAVGGEAEGELPDSAYAIAAQVELPVEVKQELLEERSERARLERLVTALRSLTEQVRRSRELAELARKNGRGRIGG